jgi:ABC-type sugar transport system substrate-binding protein
MRRSEVVRGSRMMAVAFALILATACSNAGGSPGASGAGSSGGAASASAGENVRLGLILPDLTNQTINDIYLGAQARAEELGTVEILEGGTSETGPWLDACERIVNSEIDILAYDTLDAAATSSCIQQANEMGVKTICLFACTAEGTNDALITLDFHEVGLTGGTWMGEKLAANGGGEVAILEGPPGDEAIQAVHDGFREALAEACPQCEIVAEVPGGHDRDTGYTAAQQVLTAHPNLAGIAGANDDVAMGIVRAVQEIDRIGDVLITGNNGTCEALASILAGDLSETVLIAGQPFGASTVDTALKLLNGETVETVNVTPVQIDSEQAQGIIDGSVPDVASVSMKDRLELAQSGC